MVKDHKFFETFLDVDLKKFQAYLIKQYEKINDIQLKGITPLDLKKDNFVESQSISTIKWREYNVFQFYNTDIHKIFKSLSKLIHEACEYYEIDFESQQYMVQGWFNINYTKKGKLDWHDHGPHPAPFFHGYYSVNAEPSITHYKVNGKDVENHNINNRMIVSEMAHPHAMADWSWEGPRITLAYDIVPLKSLLGNSLAIEQHWVPLL